MKPTSGTTISIWAATADTPSESTLQKNVEADVCIIGAGIAGLTTAFLLVKEGKDVVVLDDGPIGGGMTARTTAHLTNALDDRFYELERLFGEEGSRLAAESHTAAIDRVEEIVRAEGIDCEFERVDGYLFIPPDGTLKVLDDELPAAHRAGLVSVRRLERAPLKSFDTWTMLAFSSPGSVSSVEISYGLGRSN
jgi:glycine/D-amino acid oxidase-like deaminating enzyme